MKPIQKPVTTVEHEGTSMEQSRTTHPSFATIHVTHPSGHRTLFGSELKHQHYVSVTIKKSSRRRTHFQDWVFGEKEMLSFCMSESQWAQFVGGSGMGQGTPITLDYAPSPDSPMEDIPTFELESLHEIFVKESEKQAKEFLESTVKALQALTALSEQPGSIPKAEMKKLLFSLKCSFQNMPSNMGFIQDQFKEAMENIVNSGKTEMESFVNQLAIHTGLEVLKSNQPKMLDYPEKPQE